MRKTTGKNHPFIEKNGLVYVVEPGVLDVDVWRFQEQLAVTSSSSKPSPEALKIIMSCYSGDLLPDTYYGWLEPARQELRRCAVDVSVQLAEVAQQQGDFAEALKAVEWGIEVEPYSEGLYQRAFQVLETMNRPEVVQQLFLKLTSHLRELDLEPTAETNNLLVRLTKGAGVHSDLQ